MTMKEKIFNALKQAYPQLGLSNEILQHHAQMLAATGLVTDENLAQIVSQQADYLQGLQSANDKRATDAVAKAKVAAEADKAKAIDEAVKAALEAEHKRLKEEADKAKKEAEDKKRQDSEEPEFMKKFRAELAEKDKAAADREKSLADKIAELLKNGETQKQALDTLTKENEAMKAEKAAAARQSLISGTAKELGIPQWRIDEGFAIAADAGEDAIKETLSKVANNIKVNGLQDGRGLLLDDNKKVTQEEAKSIVDSLMK